MSTELSRRGYGPLILEQVLYVLYVLSDHKKYALIMTACRVCVEVVYGMLLSVSPPSVCIVQCFKVRKKLQAKQVH